jgi:hypothetical protein
VALVAYLVLILVRKWNKLDLEAKKSEIKEAEAAYKTVAEIEKNYPNYKKNKEYVEKFVSKQ